MSRIVGRMQTIFRSKFNHNGFAVVVELIQELHATKGWRLIRTSKGKTIDRNVLVFHQEYVLARPKKNYIESPPIPETALMRHGWYRRKMKLAAGLVTDADVF